jgi:hypothetical protein
MRIVADTNVVVSALLWGGPPRAIFDAAREQRIALFTSAPLIAELDDVLGRAKLVRRLSAIGRTPDELLDRYLALARFVKVDTLAPAVSRDPDDDQVIATAVAAQADLIVSGDLDLLDLGHYREIPIVAATTAIARIGAVGR